MRYWKQLRTPKMPCDWPLPSSPSGEATGADFAASTLEKDRACSNPGALLGRNQQTRGVCSAKESKTEKEPADGDDNAEETETKEETRQLEPAVKEYSLGHRESAD
ncbi:hypothetical protein NDU88_002144 [Pleurodeles waltl]|uniref:Uncharacterized protein n=1 Tax=Pleurodeles waltl TaxID=8319 RepID=A0AAV7TJZ1_PLEWA|nr:hypothetical protein NDU88_002144 [Pleurodeles waltl]